MTRRAHIGDSQLIDAVARAENGLVDADLGQKLLKQRVARAGQGRRGGFRMLLALEKNKRAVFLFGFAKNDRDNLEDDELEDVRSLCAAWLALSEEQINQALIDKQLVEVPNEHPAGKEAITPSA